MTTFRGPPPETEEGMGALTLSGFLLEVTRRFPEREAVVFHDPDGREVRWSYRDLEREARRVAHAVLGTGAGKDSRVGILMGNRPEWVAALYGVALAGGVRRRDHPVRSRSHHLYVGYDGRAQGRPASAPGPCHPELEVRPAAPVRPERQGVERVPVLLVGGTGDGDGRDPRRRRVPGAAGALRAGGGVAPPGERARDLAARVGASAGRARGPTPPGEGRPVGGSSPRGGSQLRAS